MLCRVDALNSGVGDAGAERLAANLGCATHLDLRGNAISDAGASSLAAALETNVTVHTLWLWNNKVADAGVAALARALERNSTLTELDLGQNNCSGVTATQRVPQLCQRL